MKHLGKLLAIGILLCGGWLMGQGCDPALAMWTSPGETPTFLSLIVGNNDQISPATWAHQSEKATVSGPKALMLLYAGRAADASKALAPNIEAIRADSLAADSLGPTQLADLEVAAAAAMVQGNFDTAEDLLVLATQGAGDRLGCRMRYQLLLVRYLQQYGSQAPLFPHFNSGYFNYVQDSMGWKPGVPDASGYVIALNTVAQMYRLDQSRGALYLELLGDLLSKEPNRFNANYLPALAYMRAGMLLGEPQRAKFERKAIFALEAPRQNELRFNQYRFTQLTKALQEDVDSATARQQQLQTLDTQALASGGDVFARLGGKQSDQPISQGFADTDRGRLPAILAKSKAQIDAHNAAAKRYAGDVDLQKEVKKDNRFNTFALFLIGTIVLAVVIIWRRLRKASRN
jgi:hypothetical protein